MNRIICFITILGLAFLTVSARGSQKRITVRTTADFVNNVSMENATFEIRGNVNLNGSSYTLQNGCELKVVSGYIANGEIKGRNTKLIVNKP